LDIHRKLEDAKKQLEHVSSDAYISELVGTLGADPIRGDYGED